MPCFRVACVQTNADNNLKRNLADAERLGFEAVKNEADLVTFPENVSYMSANNIDLKNNSYVEEKHPGLKFFREFAQNSKCWVLVGSLPISLENKKLANRSFMIDADGAIIAKYDKIHLFDVELSNGQVYRESKNYQAGSRAIIAKTQWAKFGLTICYDLRFPNLYRHLAQAGASVLVVPSAFTLATGKKHWHALLRARAIETGAFVVAPAQTGNHPGNRQTYGHSLIVSPSGEVLSDGGTAVGVTFADIDVEKVESARNEIPALKHDRIYKLDIIESIPKKK